MAPPLDVNALLTEAGATPRSSERDDVWPFLFGDRRVPESTMSPASLRSLPIDMASLAVSHCPLGAYASRMGRRYEKQREMRRLARPWFRRERKEVRRASNRRVRLEARSRLRTGKADALPKAPRTEGWLTW